MIGAKSGAAWRYLPASLSPAGSDSVRSGTASPGCSASENSRQNSEIRSQHSRYLFSLACFDPISFLEGEDELRTPNPFLPFKAAKAEHETDERFPDCRFLVLGADSLACIDQIAFSRKRTSTELRTPNSEPQTPRKNFQCFALLFFPSLKNSGPEI